MATLTSSRILKELRKNEKRLTLSDLARKTGVNNVIVGTLVADMVDRGLVEIEPVGPAKLVLLKEVEK